MRLLIALFFSLGSLLSIGQKVLPLDGFSVTESSYNGVDLTEVSRAKQQYIIFFEVEGEEGVVYLMNEMHAENTKSFGKITSIKREHYSKSKDFYPLDVYTFYWEYENSYDDKKGVAKGKLDQIFMPDGGVAAMLTITISSDEILQFNGFMKGNVRFDKITKSRN